PATALPPVSCMMPPAAASNLPIRCAGSWLRCRMGGSMPERIEILISGYGGQGVVRVGQILGQAAVNQGLFTTMLISHGTETRGGYVRSQVVISDQFIDSPVVERPDYFLAFSAIAYGMFQGLC